MDVIKVCQYSALGCGSNNSIQQIEVISRIGFDFFANGDKKSAS
jgi:hypothetical protein